MTQKEIERFFSKVDIREPEECWEWQASTYSSGYGQFWCGGILTSAHRVSYEFFYGEIPEGLYVLHTCDNQLCVNPFHLFSGTQQDNVDDMINKGRKSSFTGPIKGEKHYNNKLSYEDVEVIRHLYDNKHRFKVTQQEIADIFCISKSQVSKIINKESWVYQNN